jgi:hypothetical protein
VGESDDLAVLKPDMTSRANADAAVPAPVDRFGRIRVLTGFMKN